MTRGRVSILSVLMLGVLLFLQYRLWFENGGIRDMLALKKALAIQTAENEKFKKRNQELLAQVQHLQNSEEAAESRARSELGMIKKDEKFYQILR
jgi:cell division protein FtsB